LSLKRLGKLRIHLVFVARSNKDLYKSREKKISVKGNKKNWTEDKYGIEGVANSPKSLQKTHLILNPTVA